MWHYITFSPLLMQASKRTKKSYNNIMLNSQYHSHFDKMEAVFLADPHPPKPRTPTTLFSGAVKNKA